MVDTRNIVAADETGEPIEDEPILVNGQDPGSSDGGGDGGGSGLTLYDESEVVSEGATDLDVGPNLTLQPASGDNPPIITGPVFGFVNAQTSITGDGTLTQFPLTPPDPSEPPFPGALFPIFINLDPDNSDEVLQFTPGGGGVEFASAPSDGSTITLDVLWVYMNEQDGYALGVGGGGEPPVN